MTIQLNISLRTWRRFNKFHKENPDHNKPFFFITEEESLQRTLCVVNHGFQEGGLYDFTNGCALTAEEFYKKFVQPILDRHPDDRFDHVLCFCCYGGKVQNNMDIEQFQIVNETENVLEWDNPDQSYDWEEDPELESTHHFMRFAW